jgi:hypothetical protein
VEHASDNIYFFRKRKSADAFGTRKRWLRQRVKKDQQVLSMTGEKLNKIRTRKFEQKIRTQIV